MLWKKILGLIILAVGLTMYFFSNYISEQVNAGKAQISSAQEQLNVGKNLFSLSPYTKDVGKIVTKKGEEKIAEGQQTISKYERLAKQLRTGGMIVSIVGAAVFLLGFMKKKKK